MKGVLICIFCLLYSFDTLCQNLSDDFYNTVKNLKPVIMSNDYISYGGEIYTAQIYLANQDKKYTYEVNYLALLGTQKAKMENGYYNVEMIAIPGGKISATKPFEKTWKYNVKISSPSRDTVLWFESKYLIHLPIVRYNSNDTLIAYKNTPTTLTVDFPLYKDLLLKKKIFFVIGDYDLETRSYIPTDSVDIIRNTDTSVTFIPRKIFSSLTMRIGAGGNQFASKTYKVLEIPDPKIISANFISTSEIAFPITLESTDEYKSHSNRDFQYAITEGKISILRNNKTVSTQNINNYALKNLEKGDTILIEVSLFERTTTEGLKQRINLNIFKAIIVK